MSKWTQSGGLDVTLTQPRSDAVSPGMFRFTRKPAQSLTGASPVTLTLNPFPLGITSGSVSTPHYLRITDAVAGNENVLITARTSSTVTFTPTISHASGNWALGSATNGIQEAIKWVESQANGGSVQLEFGNSVIFKTIYFAGSPGVTIFGQGNWASLVISDSTFTSGDFFYCGANTCLVHFVNVHMGAGSGQTSGAGIHLKDVRVQGATLTNVRFENNYVGLDLENCDGVTNTNTNYSQLQSANPNAKAGVWIHGGTSANLIFNGGNLTSEQTNSPDMVNAGFLIESADGIVISDFVIRAEYGIHINATNASSVSSVYVSNTICDNCRINNVRIESAATPTSFTNFIFNSCHFINVLTDSENVYIVGNVTDAATRVGIIFSNNHVIAGRLDGIFCNYIRGMKIIGNYITDNNIANQPNYSGMRLFNQIDLTVVGNTIEDTRGTPLQNYGITIAGPNDYVTISGNNFINNKYSGILQNGGMTNSVIGQNSGVSTLAPTVASAATIAIPLSFPSVMLLSGVTTVNTLNGAIGIGHEVKMFVVSGLTFTGGNMANTLVAVAGQMVTLTWLGSTWAVS